MKGHSMTSMQHAFHSPLVAAAAAQFGEVMQALQQAGDTAIGVQDEAGRTLGHITRADVLAGLLDPRGAAHRQD